MEDILVSKIIETEKEAEKIILDSKETASRLTKEYDAKYNFEKKQIEKKYEELIISNQEKIKMEFDENFDKKLSEMKIQVDEIKINSQQNYDKALNILLSGVNDNGNS